MHLKQERDISYSSGVAKVKSVGSNGKKIEILRETEHLLFSFTNTILIPAYEKAEWNHSKALGYSLFIFRMKT
jgi:hypothetical protein